MVVDLKREEHRNCEIERLLNISELTIRSIWQQFCTTGNVENLPCSGRPPTVTKRAESRLLRLVRGNRGRSLRDITHDFNTGCAVNVHHKTVQRILHKNKVLGELLGRKWKSGR